MVVAIHYEDYFFSPIASQLVDWSKCENNRIKASKIMRAAEKIEIKYRVNNILYSYIKT